MMKFKNFYFAAALVMMLAACSVNDDNPSGDTPVPTESYETVLNYFKEINAVPRPSRHEEKMREYLRDPPPPPPPRIADINGGSAPNAIATSAEATVVVPNGQKALFTEHFNTYMAGAKQQYAQTDPDMTYTVDAAQASVCMKSAETAILLKGLSGAPQGVTEWSTEVAVWHRDETCQSGRWHGDLQLCRELPVHADLHLRS